MKFLHYLFLVLKGVVFGIANIIPGVSGGTMAVVMGIYDRLIQAISGILTDRSRRLSHFVFLSLLGIGAAIGLKGLAPVITYCLDQHLELTMLAFMGLIAGSLPSVIHLSGVRRLSLVDMGVLGVGVMLVLVLGISSGENQGTAINTANVSLTLFFLNGILAGGAMIIPGVSGSLILVLLGAYPVLLRAIDQIDIKLLALFGAGCGVGILIFSIVIRFLLKKMPNPTHSFIIGLVGASIVILYQGFPSGPSGWLQGSIAFIGGLMLAHGSSLISRK